MANIPFQKLQKMVITPYAQDDKGTLGEPGDPYKVMYNPTTLSVSHGQLNVGKPAIGNPTPITQQTMYGDSSTFSVELFFDGTGASVSDATGIVGAVGAAFALDGDFVSNKIKKFYETTLFSKKDSHTSRFVKVMWGKGFAFSCKLQSATTNYLLFNRSGNPIRATISASFIEVPDLSNPDQPEGTLGFMSPDITKLHTVVAGDTIYNIAKKEYENESYYLQIAETNDLKNYRKLIPGTQLILPPIKKA